MRCGVVSTSSLVPLLASNGFADVTSEKKFAGVAVPDVVPIDACVVCVNVFILMVLYLMF